MIEAIIIINIIGIIKNNIIEDKGRIKEILKIQIYIFILNLITILQYNWNSEEFQNRIEIINIPFGIDGISIILILIISIINPIIILIIKYETLNINSKKIELGEEETREERKRMIKYYMIISSTLYILFMSLNILVFFITFEIIVIPLMVFISKWGSKHEFNIPRIEAALRLYSFTIGGSIAVMIGLIILVIKYQSINIEELQILITKDIIYGSKEDKIYLEIIWSLFIFSFFSKIPIFPFHIWLPYAHTEANTIGSIILAAIVLKVATYGIIRFCIYLYNATIPIKINQNNTNIIELNELGGEKSKILEPILEYIEIILVFSLIYISILILRNLYDLKKMIAYSSIIHMNFSLFGIFSNNLLGLYGGCVLMYTHAIISTGLFFIIAILYARHHNRNLFYFSGLAHVMPIYSIIYFILTLANLSIPVFFSFIPEYFILISCTSYSIYSLIIILFSLFFFNSFGFWQTCRILFGTITPFLLPKKIIRNNNYPGVKDLSLLEILILFPLVFFSFFFSFFSSFFSSLLFPSLLLLI